MTEDQRELLAKARSSLEAARLLHARGFSGYAASRAYYAMFYIAEAFLEGEGLAFSKHSAVIGGFGRHFARTERVPREFHRYMLDAVEARYEGDYSPGETVQPEMAARHIARAAEFLELAERPIGPIPPDEGEPA